MTEHHRILIHKGLAVDDLPHGDRVLGSLFPGRQTEEGHVRFHKARMVDVQMAPWNSDVGRLTGEPAGDMEPRQHLGQPVHVP